jgi:hypothetical protein
MNCEKARELISDYIDNELDAEQIHTLEAHLFKCIDCAKEFNELASTVLLLLEVESVPVPASFDDKLRQALLNEKQQIQQEQKLYEPQKQQKPQKKTLVFTRKFKTLSGIAAILVIGIISIAMLNNMNNQNNENQMLGAIAPDEEAVWPFRATLDPNGEELFYNDIYGWDFQLDDDEILPAEDAEYPDELAEYVDELTEYLEDLVEDAVEDVTEDAVDDVTEDAAEDATEEAVEDVTEEAAEDEAGDEATEAVETLAVEPEIDLGGGYDDDHVVYPVETQAFDAEHYVGLVEARFAGMEFEILSHAYNDDTGIHTIFVEVVTVPGLITETHMFRGRDGAVWQVIRD